MTNRSALVALLTLSFFSIPDAFAQTLVMTAFTDRTDLANDVAIQPDGKIIVVGEAYLTDNDFDLNSRSMILTAVQNVVIKNNRISRDDGGSGLTKTTDVEFSHNHFTDLFPVGAASLIISGTNVNLGIASNVVQIPSAAPARANGH